MGFRANLIECKGHDISHSPLVHTMTLGGFVLGSAEREYKGNAVEGKVGIK